MPLITTTRIASGTGQLSFDTASATGISPVPTPIRGTTGPAGPDGPTGPAGPQGPAGNPSARTVDVTALGSIAGTLTIDASINRVFTLDLTGDVTAFSLYTTASGYVNVLIALTQQGSGGFNVAYPYNFRWQGGFAPALSTVVGATDLLQVITLNQGASWFAAIVMQAAP